MSDRRRDLGGAGERFAARYLTDQGLCVTATGIEVGNGELDILALDGEHRVVVEVRTITGETDPIDAIDQSKRQRVRRLAGSIGASRVDFLGLRMHAEGIDVHWVPGSS